MNVRAKIETEGAEPTPAPVPDIHGRMVAVMRELGAIGKDKKNEAQGFKYRGIDDVYNAVNPVLARHGVFMTSEIIGKTREERTNAKGTVLAFTCLRLRYHFRAEDGSSVETEVEGEGMDSGDKSSNKAMAVAHKYALLQAFCIPTQDLIDPDAEVHEVGPAKKQAYDDPDGQTRAWCDHQKLDWLAASNPDVLDEWLKANGGDWEKPKASSTLDRLKRKFPEAYNDLRFTFDSTKGDMR